MKKFLALLLAALLLMGVFAGCGTEKEEEPAPAGETETETEAEASASDIEGIDENNSALGEAVERDFVSIRTAMPLDTVVARAGDREITWNEYYYWMQYTVYQVEQSLGGILDFNAVVSDDSDKTFADYILNSVETSILQYCALDSVCREYNVTMTNETKEAMQTEMDNYEEYVMTATDMELEDYLETICMNMELLEYLNGCSYLVDDAFVKLYGENGADLSDAEVLAYAEENDYIQIKHVLYTKTDDEGNDLSEKDIAKQRSAAEKAREELLSASDRSTRMDELAADSDDPGSANYPEGYVFTYGVMVDEFEDAAYGLEVGEVSDVVETDYGFHVLLRVPLDVNASYAKTGDGLRYNASVALFDQLLESHLEKIEVKREQVLTDLDLQELFNGGK